ncbi:MAG: MATE family efflux transporter [Bacilli bacterium]|nr:MATE family efflux transporter [Bacilli bacterium]
MKKQLLTEGKISTLIFRLSLPMIIAQVINLLYNMVDRIYIGNYNGDEGLVAIGGVGACFPIIIIISAFSALFGMGGTPLAAIALGNKDKEKAEKILNHSFILLTIIALILMPILFIFKEDILYAFGANSKNIQYANDYLNIYIIGTLFVMLSLGLNQYITCQGKAIYAMISVIIGAVLNIALDPLFIYTFEMGVKGAALATIISQGVSAIFIVYFLRSKKSIIKIKPFAYKIDLKIIKQVLLLGLSPFIMQSTEALVQITFNSQIKHYITDINEQTMYLSAMTIMISIMSLINMPLQGLAQGTQPIISQNYGAGLLDRAKEASRKLILYCLIFSFSFVGLLYIFPGTFVKMFNNNSDLIDLTKKLIRIFFIGMMFMGIQIGCQNSFLALGKSKISLILAILRKIILLIPLTFILPLFFQSTGIFIAESSADILAISITLIAYLCLFKKYLNNY